MTEEQALKIAVYVLHHADETRLRSSDILRRAVATQHRQHWQAQGIDLPWNDEGTVQSYRLSFQNY